MATDMTVHAVLEGGYRFEVRTGSGYGVVVDAGEDIGGAESAPSPMEMLLVGLAGCAGISILHILRKRRQDVLAYDVRIRGERAASHPQVFTWIELEHVFTGNKIAREVVERAIALTEERYCGASVMLGETAVVTHAFKIVEESEPV